MSDKHPHDPINWHRIFGLMLTDYFTGTSYEVEMEKDLSLKKQHVDVVVVENKEGRTPAGASFRPCDGFEDLGQYNLITYKSMQESLTPWSIEELIGHGVNYRKVLGIRKVKPEGIRLYAISTRFPRGLARVAALDKIKKGVYNLTVLGRMIRLIVLGGLPPTTRNAILNLFSFDRKKVEYAHEHYKVHIPEISGVVQKLFEKYHLEGLEMSYTLQQAIKDLVREHINEIKPEERLRGLPVSDRLRGVPVDELLNELSPDDIEKFLRRKKVRRKTRSPKCSSRG